MKKNYLKSIGLVLLGGVLAMSIFSFSEKNVSSFDNNQTSPKNRISFEVDAQSLLPCEQEKKENWVPIDTVNNQIKLYQSLLKFLPEYAIFDSSSNKIRYDDRSISIDDWAILYENFQKLGLTFDSNEIKISIKNSLNHSYFIPQEDIHDALKLFDSDKAAGINVYLATEYLSRDKDTYNFYSHLYLLPTEKINNTTLNDKYITTCNGAKFALDLTDPCPALCDKNSLFYSSKIKSFQKN